jgi:uncharacterized protein
MKINLLDIGEEGHEFKYVRGEEPDIDKIVQETIDGLNDCAFNVNIMKTGDIFTATGRFTLEKDDVCSKCGQDIQIPIDHKFTEFLMNESRDDADQKGHAPHSGLNLENDQEVTFVQGHVLDLGEFIREQVAVAIPSYPVCADKAACEARQKDYKKYFVEEKTAGHPAFAVLGQLKDEKKK